MPGPNGCLVVERQDFGAATRTAQHRSSKLGRAEPSQTWLWLAGVAACVVRIWVTYSL